MAVNGFPRGVPPRLDPGAGLTERLVELPGGRRLRAVVAGDAPGPLVVFEAGMSAPAAEWVHTQRQISERARTLSYDRAGYGGSDDADDDRSLDHLAGDLAALLDALGETEPVVLVGHSWGGPILRTFAHHHPRRVAGLVFVDATLAEVMSPALARVVAASFRLHAGLARIGATRLIERATLPQGFSPDISAEDRAILLRDHACVRAMRAGRREARQIVPSLPLLRRLQAAGTPDVPTVCLQAGRLDRGTAKVRPLFNRTAAELMAAVPRGDVIVVEGIGHAIPQEHPNAVRDAIVDLLAVLE
ncbi:alpha/beta fold hydrolase [Amycolatopsis suaedae]|uniref:Alpha/beta hydrolase n=1 Tax=Amycolatopsis suaedae TaxID=2510978 RepID=A0A4Q7J316_9PSEU|nr:alpha/beta hydrolase [Amycolatopsis suaedae]RZQ60986.1 alpha/beta hydrolase [Amycolatopsis suaedae]